MGKKKISLLLKHPEETNSTQVDQLSVAHHATADKFTKLAYKKSIRGKKKGESGEPKMPELPSLKLPLDMAYNIPILPEIDRMALLQKKSKLLQMKVRNEETKSLIKNLSIGHSNNKSGRNGGISSANDAAFKLQEELSLLGMAKENIDKGARRSHKVKSVGNELSKKHDIFFADIDESSSYNDLNTNIKKSSGDFFESSGGIEDAFSAEDLEQMDSMATKRRSCFRRSVSFEPSKVTTTGFSMHFDRRKSSLRRKSSFSASSRNSNMSAGSARFQEAEEENVDDDVQEEADEKEDGNDSNIGNAYYNLGSGKRPKVHQHHVLTIESLIQWEDLKTKTPSLRKVTEKLWTIPV